MNTANATSIWKHKRVKTPTVIQMEALECGAAALGIVLGYFGHFVPLEQLRVECGISRDGSRAVNILKAARQHGMTAKGFRKDPQGLKQLPLPQILFWNFNHFVVLEGLKRDGIKGDKVFINDPATGHRVVSFKELDEAFTGVVLSIVPGPEFQKGGAKPGVWHTLKGRWPGLKPGLAFAVLAGLALVIPGLAVPLFLKIFVDEILVGRQTHWLMPLITGMSLTLLVNGLLTWLKETSLLRQQIALAVTTSARFFDHVLRLPYAFFTQRYAGEIGSRVLLNDRVAVLLSGELATTALSMLTILFFSVLLFWYDALLTVIGLVLAALQFSLLHWVSRKRTDLGQRVLQERGKLTGMAMNGLNLMETIKATGSESDFFTRWAGLQAKALNAQQALSRWTHLLSPLPMMLGMLNTAAILGIGALRVMEGHLTMGMLVAFQSLMLSFMVPVGHMVHLGARFQDALADMKRLDDVLCYPPDPLYQDPQYQIRDLEPEPTSAAASVKLKLSGRLTLEGVTFGYSPLDPPLIKDFNLQVAPGARVALVGRSGSGKSTLARLVCGLFQPVAGQILFDGLPRGKVPRGILLNSLAYVDQDIFLFSGTVRDNLTMWNSAVAEADLVRAAKDAAIHDDISARNGAYDHPVAEGGHNFSGGQRQRLEIARALVCDPSLLVLDEATSALDPETELAIDAALRRRGCTCLIVAHRLSTIRDCDEIIVLDRGNVVQRGVHQDLSRHAGPYRRLIET